VKKLIVLAAGACAATSLAIIANGLATAQPNSGVSALDVTGEPYAKAVAILHSQGVSTMFGGSLGGDVPQNMCIVASQKVVGNSKMSLMLDCTKAAQPQPDTTPVSGAPGAPAQEGGGGRPTPGAPGIVTVIPTQVG
jgi:hypothetical protein